MRVLITQFWPVRFAFCDLLPLPSVADRHYPHVHSCQADGHAGHANGEMHAFKVSGSSLGLEDEANGSASRVANQLYHACGKGALEVSRVIAGCPDKVQRCCRVQANGHHEDGKVTSADTATGHCEYDVPNKARGQAAQ